MTVIKRLFRLIFDCSHRHTTRPQTKRWTDERGYHVVSYIVCLECGCELPYDVENWKRVA